MALAGSLLPPFSTKIKLRLVSCDATSRCLRHGSGARHTNPCPQVSIQPSRATCVTGLPGGQCRHTPTGRDRQVTGEAWGWVLRPPGGCVGCKLQVSESLWDFQSALAEQAARLLVRTQRSVRSPLRNVCLTSRTAVVPPARRLSTINVARQGLPCLLDRNTRQSLRRQRQVLRNTRSPSSKPRRR